MTDSDLLEHYLARAAPEAAAWNLSPECAYLDYRMRAWARELLAGRPGLRVLNIGIGVGEWDDYLGVLVGPDGQLTSLDIDPVIVETLAARQRRERHPNPATVICADALRWQTDQRFDVVTMVGSTAGESGDSVAIAAAALELVADDGALVLMLVGADASSIERPAGAAVVRDEIDGSISEPIRLLVLAPGDQQ